jgi:hypothetical protein
LLWRFIMGWPRFLSSESWFDHWPCSFLGFFLSQWLPNNTLSLIECKSEYQDEVFPIHFYVPFKTEELWNAVNALHLKNLRIILWNKSHTAYVWFNCIKNGIPSLCCRN